MLISASDILKLLGWMREAEIREWLTFALAGLGASLGVLEYRRRAKEDAAARAAAWDISLAQHEEGPEYYRASLRLRDVQENRFHLLDIQVISPKGARLACARHRDIGAGNWVDEPNEDTLSRRLVVDRPLGPDWVARDRITYLPDSTLRFFVRMPKRPFYRRGPKCRLSIRVSAEERSPSRRHICLVIKTQKITWAADSPASTT